MTVSNAFPRLLQTLFTERLVQQRRASAETIASYREAFRLLLRFASQRLGKSPAELSLDDLSASLVSEFLHHLEQERRNTARTRNVRLAAVHSFFRYVSFCEPAWADGCRRILAIPAKRQERKPIAFLSRDEIDALVCAPDQARCVGRRDRALLLVAIQTGLRVSELIGLRCEDVILGTGAHLRCEGKGRKQRCTPLRREASAVMAAWLRERKAQPQDPVFPSTRGARLSRDAVERLVTKHARAAPRGCASLRRKTVTPHVLRHTTAMDLLSMASIAR